MAALIRLASFCELNQLDEEVIRQNCVEYKRWWCTSMWIVHYWRGNCDNWLFLFIASFFFLICSWLELKKLKKLFLSERYYIGEICKLFLFVLTNCSIMFPIVINWRNILHYDEIAEHMWRQHSLSHPSWNMVMQKLVMIGHTLINLCECSASVLLHQPALHPIFSYWVG